MSSPVYTAPRHPDHLVLGKTLPEILYDSVEKYNNPRFLNQPTGDTWRPISLREFATAAEETAMGLQDLGLARKDRVGLYLESDAYFGIADMGCLIGGFINVPIYVTHAAEAITFVLNHSESKVLFVSTPERLAELAPVLPKVDHLQTIVVADPSGDASLPAGAGDVELMTLDELRARGRDRLQTDAGAIPQLVSKIDPGDTATLIYTSGTTGQPKGVILTHENISSNALTCYNELEGYREGASGEVAISFLPLTHIFARTLHYGFMSRGTSVYFTTPDDLGDDLKKVQPTVFATVPRLLEKVYAKIQTKTEANTGLKKALGLWALDLAKQYELGEEPSGLFALQLKLANKLVFSKWREALGGRVRFVVSGGAALNSTICNVFNAAGVPILQGYGLTETSPVITFNRVSHNRAGAVGEPIPGVEVMIADDGEVLTRGPHVMKGYYKNKEQTAEVLTEDGWFHTGDIGEMTNEGYLKITDRKKDLFKLSTGKYVTPQPLENTLAMHGIIEHAVVIGNARKFCAALIFPEEETVRTLAGAHDLDPAAPLEQLLQEPAIYGRIQALVDEANEGMDHWSTIKRFVLVPGQLAIENGMLTPTMKVRRPKVRARYEEQIENLYSDDWAPPVETQEAPVATVAT